MRLCKKNIHIISNPLRYFHEFREVSDPPIDSKDPNMIKAQKCSKDIGKIVHVTSVVFFTKLREYFLCTKKTKITTLFNN